MHLQWSTYLRVSLQKTAVVAKYLLPVDDCRLYRIVNTNAQFCRTSVTNAAYLGSIMIHDDAKLCANVRGGGDGGDCTTLSSSLKL